MAGRWHSLLLLTALLPLTAWAEAVLPPGREAAVLEWLLPLAQEAPVNPASPPDARWTLQDVRVQRSTVQLGLRGPAGQAQNVQIQHASGKSPGTLAGDVRVQCPPGLPSPVCQAVMDALALPGPSAPWQVLDDAPQEDAQRPAELRRTALARWVLGGAWVVLLGLLAWLVWGARRALTWPLVAATGRGLAWPLATASGLGLGVRLWLSPQTLLHEFHHTRESLGFLDGPSVFANGESMPALIHGLHPLLPGVVPEDLLFRTNLVLAALSVPALGWLVRQVGGSRGAALTSAVLLALLPVHVRWSACEEFWAGGILLTLVTLAATALALQTGRRLAWLVVGVAMALAMQSRPELLMLPTLVATFALTLSGVGAHLGRALRRPWLWVAVLLTGALCWHVPDDLAMRGGAARLIHWDPQAIWLRHFAQDRGLLGWGLAGLLALGLAWGVRHHTRLTLWAAGVAVGLSVLLLAFFDSPGPYPQRQQLLSLVLLLIPAGMAVDALGRWLPRRLALVLVLTLPAAELVHAQGWIAQTGTQQAEFAFLRDAMPLIPDRARVLSPPVPMLDTLPAVWLERWGRSLRTVDVTLRASAGQWPSDGPDLLFFQGMYCWFQWPEDPHPPVGMHPACQAVRNRYVLEPILERNLGTQASLPMVHAPQPGGYVVGVYRLRPRP